MKNILNVLLISIALFQTEVFSAILDDLRTGWSDTPEIFVAIQQKILMENYPNYEKATPSEQDLIRNRVRADLKKIQKGKVLFEKQDKKFDNSIFGGLFHYENNESMYTVIEKQKTVHYFFESDILWRVVITISTDQMKKKLTLNEFTDYLTSKHGKPIKIDYDQFIPEEEKVIKAYFRDYDTLLELTYNDIYDSFILVYSSLDKLKEFREKGLQVISKKDEIKNEDITSHLSGYDDLSYESTESDSKEDIDNLFDSKEKEMIKSKDEALEKSLKSESKSETVTEETTTEKVKVEPKKDDLW
ncbi:hypothetical protein JXR93_08820 [bacterium]|nr:hypothetical protein [bacterium]